MATIRVIRDPDVATFRDVALPFLLPHEAEDCVLLGFLGGSRPAPDGAYHARVVEGDTLIGVACFWPPGGLLISAGSSPKAIGPIVDDLAAGSVPVSVSVPVPWMVAVTPLADAFAAAWARRSGAQVRLAMDERVHRLDSVNRPRAVEGAARPASVEDRALLADWLDAFETEALGSSDPAWAAGLADRFLAGPADERGLWLWTVNGAPVSMAGFAGKTPTGTRIMSVFTPPERRRRGFASALVASLCQAQLDAGRRTCFLFTDRANATANHIYASIGFVPVADFRRYDLGGAGGA